MKRCLAVAVLVLNSLVIGTAQADFAWRRLPAPDAGELVFADTQGFATYASGRLSLFTPEAALRRVFAYEGMGAGQTTVFPDAWAIEIGGSPALRIYDADGRLRRAGTAAEVSGQAYLPTRAAKQGVTMWLEVSGGVVALDLLAWQGRFYSGGRLPDSPWAEESYTLQRRLAGSPTSALEEIALARINPQGVLEAVFRLPVSLEAPHCLMAAYPLSDDRIVLSANAETLVLDRRSFAIQQRLPWNSCLPACAVGTPRYAAQAWWQGAALGYAACETRHGTATSLRRGEHGRSDAVGGGVIAGTPAALRLPLGRAAAWDGAGRVYTSGEAPDSGGRIYGVYDLRRAAVSGGGWRQADRCQLLDLSLPVAGGTPPQDCFQVNGEILPGCRLQRPADASCAFGPQLEPLQLVYWVGDAAGDRREARFTVLPLPGNSSASQPRPVYEFFNTVLQHYFMTINGFERDAIAAGAAGPGWSELGPRFLAWLPEFAWGEFFAPTGAWSAVPVCRFYGAPGVGPNSHFYTLAGRECEAVKRDPGWLWEAANTFYLLRPDVEGACPPWTQAIWRAYNNRAALNDSNHRYAIDRAALDAMAPAGWVVEGVAMCAPRL